MYIENQTFENQDYSENHLPIWEYENCIFKECNFSHSSLSHVQFIDCEFQSCNLTMVQTFATKFQNIHFIESKLLWVDFKNCNEFLFEVRFTKSNLELASFSGMKIKNTIFDACELKEVNFTGADCSWACFSYSQLDRAIFQRTKLENADFQNAYNYTIDPEENSMTHAQFSLEWIPGLLTKYNITIY